MESFTPFSALAGGLLIGTSAALMLWGTGQIAGVSGILGGLVPPRQDSGWRFSFFAGMIVAALVYSIVSPASFAFTIDRSAGALIAAGLLVGFGTRLGNGCTSGHGVCGMSRLSTRSIVATMVFMATGVATVFVVNQMLGGGL